MSEQPRRPGNGLEWFGNELEEALRHSGKTGAALAAFTGYKPPYVSKVKNGQALPSPEFAEGCDRFFNTSGYFARTLVRVSERAHPEWFVPYVNLERQARQIEDYSNALIMGMLQTWEYAEATFRATFPYETDAEIKTRVEARLARREVIERDDPPVLWVILHETTLRTLVGNHAVMAEQLRHLAADAEKPHVTLQVLRSLAGAPASGTPFTLLTPDDGPTVLYTEAMGQGHVTDSAQVVSHGRASFERLRASARDPEESVALIRKIAEEYDR
ncbi:MULTISPECIES: helix-turn-helix domain-containing protein [unclassified Streptomyces]|uniref:helix-turn-helix domain-containing protein n=1 Tax=unclassified Streptomyces TaxID=2593676 RepID=UPI000DAEF3DD|nr:MULTISPECIES: helix-turn-helix transcriptional regulator [unclassified Streptomyces]PZT76635.1 transcriptional regulator [Streptomyces sp. AC1-42W]PZT79408.1 transcriptional regulator [Streptomyces sp. AC1-42T]